MKKRIIVGMVLIILMGVILPWSRGRADTAPADTVVYDAAEFADFQGRTKEEVGRRYGEAMYAGDSYINGDSSSYYETMYSLENPYVAGKLTEDTHKTMTAMTDFYRWLVGVQPLQAASVHSDKLQAEALVRNFEFNHTISDDSKPEDMTQEFWDYGAKNYIHTILAIYSTPHNAITSWMNEGYNHSRGWDTVGHRYALIGATVSDVQFGYAGSVAAGEEKAYENTMKNPFSAYPAPGYMPANLVHSSSSAWSIQIDKNQITVADRTSVVVKVTNMDTKESYECTTENGKLQASEYSTQIVFVQPVLSSGSRYESSYQVEVSGLSDVESGKDAVLNYTTEFFDPTEYTPSYVKTVTADEIEKYIIYKDAATTENLKKIAYALPEEVTVVTENGRTAKVPVKGNWILNEEEQCWVNEADASKLPSDITDRENVLKNCAIYYEISESIYDSYNSLNISPRVAKVGDKAQMSVYLTLTSADASAIFQLVAQEDGSYIGKKKFDSRTATEFGISNNGSHLYTIPSLQKSDEGEYFSIYYDSDSWDAYAYVSTEICTLTVQEESQSGNDPQQTPDVTPGGGNTSSPGTSATPDVTPGGGNSPAPGSSITPGSGGNPVPGSSIAPDGGTGEISGNTDGGSKSDTEVGKDKRNIIPKVAKVSRLKGKIKTKAKKKTLDLTWKKVSGASGYQIQIGTKKSFKGAKKISLKKNKSKYHISNLKAGKKYYIRICAYQLYHEQSGKVNKAYGKWTVKRITMR